MSIERQRAPPLRGKYWIYVCKGREVMSQRQRVVVACRRGGAW